MNKKQILIVEDEADIQQLVSYNLIRSDFHVSCADSAEEALEHLKKTSFACILLDIMLPGMSGLELCAHLRENTHHINHDTPIIMMTAKGEEEDMILGLGQGADDYITKPFSPKVMIARVKAATRRVEHPPTPNMAVQSHSIEIDGVVIDRGRHEVRVAGVQVHLTLTEFGILELLAEKPGWVFSRQQIIDRVRGYDFLVTPRAIDVQIFGLRKKLGAAGASIETVRGIGYRFQSLGQNPSAGHIAA